MPIVNFKMEIEDAKKNLLFTSRQSISVDESAWQNYQLATGTTDQQIPFDLDNGVGSINILLLESDQNISWRQSASDTAITLDANRVHYLGGTGLSNVLVSNSSGSTANVYVYIGGPADAPVVPTPGDPSTYATGDLLYASSTTALSRLAIGTAGNSLIVNQSSLPAWIDKGFINVKEYGAVGDGVTDDYTSFALAATQDSPLNIPDGTYLLSSGVTFTQDIIGTSKENTIIKFYDDTCTGTLVTLSTSQRGATISNLTLQSSRSTNVSVSQSGLSLYGQIAANAYQVRVQNFDIYGIQLGQYGVSSGNYWASLSEIHIAQDTGLVGEIGLRIPSDGLDSQSNSNDNVFQNVVVSGRHGTMVFVGGNGNTFIGGGIEASSNTNINKGYHVEGSRNTFINQYIEFTDTATIQPVMFDIDGDHNRTINTTWQRYPRQAIETIVQDDGMYNVVDIKNGYLRSATQVVSSKNLWKDPRIKYYDSLSRPYGIQNNPAGFSIDTTVNYKDGNSVKFTPTGTNIYLYGYLTDTTPNRNGVDIEFLKGKRLHFSIKALTTVVGAGFLQLTIVDPTAGNVNLTSVILHSGSGEWETIEWTSLNVISDTATGVLFYYGSGDVTGDVWVAYPTIEIIENEEIAENFIQEKGGLFTGDVIYIGGGRESKRFTTLADDATPSVAGGNNFVTGGTTTITDFDDGVEGQVITIVSEHAITITDGTNIFLNGSANFVMAATDTLTLICKADNKWYELSRSDNT